MRRLLTCICFFLCLLLASCQEEFLPCVFSENEAGDCTLEVNFGTSAMVTKAGVASAADGDIFNNVRVYLVDNSNKVVGFASSEGADPIITINPTGGYTDPYTSRTTCSASGIIRKLDIGEYSMYAIANAPNVAGLNWDSFGVGTYINDNFKKAIISLATGQLSPSFSEAEGMPLSLLKPVTILSGNNTVSGNLLRICARLKVSFSNNISAAENKNLCITSLSFSAKNPDRTYVYSDKDKTVPAYTTRNFESYNITSVSMLQSITSGHTLDIYDSYIYETGASMGTLQLTIKGGIISTSKTPAFTPNYIYSIGEAVKPVNVSTGVDYVIKNQNVNLYLRRNNSSDKVEGGIFTNPDLLTVDGNFDRYIWRVENKSGNELDLKNVSANKYLNIPVASSDITLTNSPDNRSIVDNDDLIYHQEEILGKYYQMRRNGESVNRKDNNKKNTGSDYKWYFYPVTSTTIYSLSNADENFNETINVSYIDKYSVEQSLTSIMRNSVVDIHINVYYSSDLNVFTFKVQNWTEHTYNTTFD